MSNHQNEHQPKPEAEKIKLAVIISDEPPVEKAIDGSSLTTEEKKQWRGPSPKKARYPMSASASAMRRMKLENREDLSVWLNTDLAGHYLGCSPAAIRMKRMRGQIKGTKFFGRWYFKRSDLDRAIESSNKGGN